VLAGLLLLPFARSRAAAGDPHAAFVARAFANRDLAVAAGDQPYGAVVVCGGRVVADGISAVVTKSDSTAHAEMEAIRLARQRLGRLDLSDCTLYGTSRACPMCERAAAQANIARLYHGRSADGGEPPRAP
jgi:tRNA(adenine34) deaminase